MPAQCTLAIHDHENACEFFPLFAHNFTSISVVLETQFIPPITDLVPGPPLASVSPLLITSTPHV